ncbi:hypothetical protein COY95_03720, partial [Candidatus Woesearchaeota archaeon CG_4_10_14_0_8_um_filter_47_5]
YSSPYSSHDKKAILQGYIESERLGGVSDHEIAAKLREAGWSHAEIKDALNKNKNKDRSIS